MAKFTNIDAIEVKYNDIVFYVAVMKASKLFSISEVSRADEDPEEGYQRLLGKARAKKIAEYLNSGHVIPGALVLSAKQDAIQSYDKTKKKLKVSNEQGGFLVIDGQHRLYGAHQYGNDIPMPICIFNNLDKAQEVQYFLDINGTQRGVPKTLQIELTKFTAEPESKEDLLMRLFNELDSQVRSPLASKLSRTKSVAGKLSHVPFQNSFKQIIDKAPLVSINFDNKVNIIINFLSAIENILIEEYGASKKLTNAAFFQAIMDVFIEACSMSILKHNNYKESSFLSVLSGISDIDLDKYSGTNKKSINELSSIIREKITVVNSLSDDLF